MARRILLITPLLAGCSALHTRSEKRLRSNSDSVSDIVSKLTSDSISDATLGSQLDAIVTIQSGGQLSVVESFGSSDPIPEWCKNDTQLSWKQRKERLQQHFVLDWTKKAVQELRKENETIPEWMQKMVDDDKKRGQIKWAVQEYRKMMADGKEAPDWMKEIFEEDRKWTNRWAACKAAELKSQKIEIPEWMVENARKGIVEYATEKANMIEEQIEELEEEKQHETALVEAHGDPTVAGNRMLVIGKESKTWTLAQQESHLQETLQDLSDAEDETRAQGVLSSFKLRKAIRRAQDAADMLTRMLNRKAQTARYATEAEHGGALRGSRRGDTLNDEARGLGE